MPESHFIAPPHNSPGTYCFPGGAIEPGETPPQTVRREMLEELGVEARPKRLLWRSVTAWNVALSWWLTTIRLPHVLRPNPLEVDQVLWLTAVQMRNLPALLVSNVQFLDAYERGDFHLPGDERFR